MSGIDHVAPFSSETLHISAPAADRVLFAGSIAVRDPAGLLQAHLRRIHDTALLGRLPKLTVDARKLGFVNSSALRLFIDWVAWLKKEPPDRRYRMVLIYDPTITWQKTSFSALRSMGGDAVEVRAET